MPAVEKEIYEQIYKLSTEGHDKVLNNLGDIHKAVLGIAEDVAFKPLGFKTLISEAKKAKASVDGISKSLQQIPKNIAGTIKKDFAEGFRGLRKDIAKEAKAASSFWGEAFSGKSVGKISPAVQAAIQDATEKGLKEGVDDSAASISKALETLLKHAPTIKPEFDPKAMGLPSIEVQPDIETATMIEQFEVFKDMAATGGKEFQENLEDAFQRGEDLIEDMKNATVNDKNLVGLQRSFRDTVKGIQKSFEKGSEGTTKDLKDEVPKIMKGGSDFIYDAFHALESPEAFFQGIGKAGEFLQKKVPAGLEKWSRSLDKKGGLLGKGAKKAAGKGAGAAAGGGGAGGAALSGLGKVAMVAGAALAAVAAIGALVKLLLEADSAIKDFNKSMLSNVGAGNLMAATFLEGKDAASAFHDGLDTLYKAGNDFGFFLRTGIKHEEFAAALGAMSKAGWTFADVTGQAGDDAKNLQDAVNLANVASKNFGIGLTEGAETIGDWRKNLGMSTEAIAMTFAQIQQDALEANMDVGKFFNTVKNVSSDFVLFGVRAHEVSGMLELLGKSVGPKKAAEMIGGLVGQMKNMGEQDRIRIVALAGHKKTLDALRGSQMRGLKSLKDQNGAFFASAGNQDLYNKALQGNVGAIEELQKKAAGTKGMDEVARRLSTFAEVAREAKAGLVGAATGIASADLQAQVEVQFSAIERFTGPIAQASGIQAMVARQQLGLSLEQWKAIKGLDAGMRSAMEKQTKEAVKYGGSLAQLQKETGIRNEYLKIGNTLYKQTADGTWRQAKKTDFMSDKLKKQVANMDTQQTVAEKAAQATISMSEVMKEGFKNVLRSLGHMISIILRDLLPPILDLAGVTTPYMKAQQKIKDVGKIFDEKMGGFADQGVVKDLKKGLMTSGADATDSDMITKGVSEALKGAEFSPQKLVDVLTARGWDEEDIDVGAFDRLFETMKKGGIEAEKAKDEFAKSLGDMTESDLKDFTFALSAARKESKLLKSMKEEPERSKKEAKKMQDKYKAQFEATHGKIYMGRGDTGIQRAPKVVMPKVKEETKPSKKLTPAPIEKKEPVVTKSPAQDPVTVAKNTYRNAQTQSKTLKKMATDGIKLVSKDKKSFADAVFDGSFRALMAYGLLKQLGAGFDDVTNLKERLGSTEKMLKWTMKGPASAMSGEPATHDMLVSKTGYVKLSAGDIAFNPSEAARGMRAPAGALAGKAMARLATAGGGVGGGKPVSITRNQSNTFNIQGDPAKVKKVVMDALAEDKRREAELGRG